MNFNIIDQAANLMDSAIGSLAGALGFTSNNNAWFIYDEEQGGFALFFSSVISADVRSEGQVVSAPIEEGGFASYNKVEQPIVLNATLAFMGSESDIQDAVFRLQDLRRQTRLVSIVTPDYEFESMTLESFSYSRTRENGVGVLFCDLSFLEVRQVQAQYTNVKIARRKKRGLQKAEETSALSGITSRVSGLFGG